MFLGKGNEVRHRLACDAVEFLTLTVPTTTKAIGSIPYHVFMNLLNDEEVYQFGVKLKSD